MEIVTNPRVSLTQQGGGCPASNQHAAHAAQRRSIIYAATRRLVADRGLAKITIREIAHESAASVQTLYNLVGDRDRIIVEAIKEHIGVLASFSGQVQSYPNPIIALTDAYCVTCTAQPRYALNSLSAPSTTRIYNSNVERYVSDLYGNFIEKLASEGKLRAAVDRRALARRIIIYSIGTIVDWGGRSNGAYKLREELLTGVSCLLLRSLETGVADALQDWLDTIEIW